MSAERVQSAVKELDYLVGAGRPLSEGRQKQEVKHPDDGALVALGSAAVKFGLRYEAAYEARTLAAARSHMHMHMHMQ